MSLPETDLFAPFAANMRAEGLAPMVIETFARYYTALRSGASGLIPEAEIAPVASLPALADLETYAEHGIANLDKVGVLKLNGGLGTSMGLERAKSLLVARDGLSFLDIITRQTLADRQRFGEAIPLVLMDSFATDADTLAVLANYPDLPVGLPLTVLQNKVPKILQADFTPAASPADPELAWCPPGHGEVYLVLAATGLLDELLARGVQYLFISNADNLGATLDPRILGYLLARELPFLMEVAHRTEADKKGGHLAQRPDGQLLLREVAQCPEADLAAFQDIGRHRFFNTNNLWVSLPALKQVLADHDGLLELPMIRNAKTLDPKDPASPPVFQLETAMGAAIAVFPGAEALSVSRDRFLPVKLCADLLGLRSDLYVTDARYRLLLNPARTLGPLTVTLDPKHYKLIDQFEARFPAGPPSLVDCERLTVQGDVRFGRDVVCTGAVSVQAEHAPASIMDGAQLGPGSHTL